MTYATPKTLGVATLALLALYLAAAVILPGSFISSFFAAVQLTFAVLICATWLPDTYRSLHEPALKSPHMALLGISLLALGSAYSGTFGLLWNFAGQPDNWTGGAMSSFGRALIAAGFACLLISPAQAPRPRIALGLWAVVAIVGVIVALAFLAGYAFNPRVV